MKQRIPESEIAGKTRDKKESDNPYRVLFEKSKDAILIIKNEQFVDCNQATLDMLGYNSKSKLLKTHPSELSPDFQPDGKDSFAKAKEMMVIALKNGSHRFEWNHIRANGDVFPVEVLLTAISNQEGNQVFHTTWRDITNRIQAEKARQEEKETLSTILESTPHGITLLDNYGKYLYVNPYFTKMTGYTLKDVPTKEVWFDKAYPDKEYRKKVSGAWGHDSNDSDQEKIREYKIKCKNGQTKYIAFRSTFLTDKTISVLTDITQHKKAEEALKESEERIRAILFATPDPIVLYNNKGEPEYLNPAFVDLFGWSIAELIGKRIPFVPDDQKKITAEKLKELFDSGNKVQFETKRLTKHGSSIGVIVSASCIKNLKGEISKLVVILTDITEQKQAKEELKLLNLKLEHRATHDFLTGAPNRRAIIENLKKELIRAKRKNSTLSIGLCDIDHFKHVNDKYGHHVGDDVLCGFVKAVQNILRPYDLLGRYGGEEFLIIVPDLSGSVEEDIYERVRAEIADHKIITKSGKVGITISIGVTNTRKNETVDAMLTSADAALYRAKDNGRNQVVIDNQ
ncbi:MAG: PAS domain S-box protein [Desulfobacteraceae bacterium]|nr:PAS domain S-box protein [Desulfobacteraceae bacterium]